MAAIMVKLSELKGGAALGMPLADGVLRKTPQH